MKLPLLLLVLTAPFANAAVLPDEHFRIGEAALADELWDVAAIHFGEILNLKPLQPDDKTRATLLLAEALIRSGKPDDALKLLDSPTLSSAPGIHFWKGQALAALDLLPEALQELDTAAQTSPDLAVEAALTRSSLFLSLRQPDDALAVLRPLTRHSDPSISIDARLREVEILLDLGRTADARKTMPPLADVPATKSAGARFIEASLLLAESKPAEAEQWFFDLVSDPSRQSLSRHHAASLGYADAIATQGDTARASDSLLSFIQENPASPFLDDAFSRLIHWLPQEPAANHPVLLRLSQWAKPRSTAGDTLLPGAATSLETSNIAGTSPLAAGPSNLTVEATFALAQGLRRMANPASRAEAGRLLTWLELNYPQHPLTPRVLLLSARWLLDDNHPDRAGVLLDHLVETFPDTPDAGEAYSLKARAAYTAGAFSDAADLYRKSADSLSGPAARSAALNAAIARFRHDGTFPVATAENPGSPAADPALQADLELEQALLTTPPDAARAALETFLTRHPGHPRADEARLAAANAALTSQPPDLSMAKAQLDTIAATPPADTRIPPEHLALARLRLADLSGDPAATIAAAKAFVETYPESPSAREASLILGRSLYQTENYNDALITLKNLASSDPDPARSQAAWLLAASSAARVGTPQSRESALDLFDQAAQTEGPLGTLVKMEKAQLLIDLNRFQEATAYLQQWYAALPATDPLRLPAGFLFGDAAYAQGEKSPATLAKSLEIYDQLLDHPATRPADIHRIQYLRGRTLEQLPRPEAPSQKRDGEALAAYYSVLKNAANPPAEWHFLESSGFRALEILERASRWTAAIKIAKEISAFNGPRAKEAADRARDIQLKTMIWED